VQLGGRKKKKWGTDYRKTLAASPCRILSSGKGTEPTSGSTPRHEEKKRGEEREVIGPRLNSELSRRGWKEKKRKGKGGEAGLSVTSVLSRKGRIHGSTRGGRGEGKGGEKEGYEQALPIRAAQSVKSDCLAQRNKRERGRKGEGKEESSFP